MIGRISLEIEDCRIRGEGRKIIGSIIEIISTDEGSVEGLGYNRKTWTLVAHVHMCDNKLL